LDDSPNVSFYFASWWEGREPKPPLSCWRNITDEAGQRVLQGCYANRVEAMLPNLEKFPLFTVLRSHTETRVGLQWLRWNDGFPALPA